jgi:hypothetical protein
VLLVVAEVAGFCRRIEAMVGRVVSIVTMNVAEAGLELVPFDAVAVNVCVPAASVVAV